MRGNWLTMLEQETRASHYQILTTQQPCQRAIERPTYRPDDCLMPVKVRMRISPLPSAAILQTFVT
jgi:hypothetical protein